MGVVAKVSMPGIDEIAREHFIRTLKRSVIALVLLIISVLVVNEKDRLLQMVDHPVEKISVLGQFSHIDSVLLKEHVGMFIGGGFLSADLEEVKERVEALPWVYQAQVSRVWPGEISLLITEQMPVGYWNDEGFINPLGQLFTPKVVDKEMAIPRLVYPGAAQDAGRLEMYDLYRYIQKELSTTGLKAIVLTQSARGAWDVTLENGIVIALGHIDLDSQHKKYLDDKLERVSKLFLAKSDIAFENVKTLDTRYPNGIAIEWKAPIENKN